MKPDDVASWGARIGSRMAAAQKVTLPALYAKHSREIAALVRAALRDHGGNTSHAAKALNVPRTTLLRLIGRLGLADEMASKEGRPPIAG